MSHFGNSSSSWSSPDDPVHNADHEEDPRYRCLVVDSGPIIKHTGVSALWKRAHAFYTVPAVVAEIRDAKARAHLEQLPFVLLERVPSDKGMQAVIEFARQTGDYQSLSSVDLQVLALLYDLEREGCGIEHIRTTPKRTVGVGKIEALGGDSKGRDGEVAVEQVDDDDDVDDDESEDESDKEEFAQATSVASQPTVPPSCWAQAVHPSAKPVVETASAPTVRLVDPRNVPVGKLSLDAGDGGQFSDAEEGGDDEVAPTVEQDLQSEFPSLAAAMTVPYEGSDDESEGETDEQKQRREREEEEEHERQRKAESLKPITKSGKLYNSFRKYGDLMKPKPATKPKPNAQEVVADIKAPVEEDAAPVDNNQSRIIGGMTLAGQEVDVEDDGEGWITNTKEIKLMKAAGVLDPTRNPNHADGKVVEPSGPPMSQRTACATTDFAMQNVILQMNLELVSVDGMKVRKLKSWVTRCGACFKVYTSTENNGPLGTKRLFCEHCGSDMMQRIAASVDKKTGRLRLHLSKKHKNNLRGTKYSLPKPGTGNRFQGDLLLREDQLLMGAWNQKVKMRSGGKARAASQSIFGKDIASNVGCHANAVTSDDIRVGFGRRNPNAAKGRERRGKKKKSADKACGLRRY